MLKESIEQSIVALENVYDDIEALGSLTNVDALCTVACAIFRMQSMLYRYNDANAK